MEKKLDNVLEKRKLDNEKGKEQENNLSEPFRKLNIKNLIVISGSTKFNAYIKMYADKLRSEGLNILIPEEVPYPQSKHRDEQVINKNFYNYAIRNCISLQVFNAYGYIGTSVTMEIMLAIFNNKEVILLLEPEKEEFKELQLDDKLIIDISWLNDRLPNDIINTLKKKENAEEPKKDKNIIEKLDEGNQNVLDDLTEYLRIYCKKKNLESLKIKISKDTVRTLSGNYKIKTTINKKV